MEVVFSGGKSQFATKLNQQLACLTFDFDGVFDLYRHNAFYSVTWLVLLFLVTEDNFKQAELPHDVIIHTFSGQLVVS